MADKFKADFSGVGGIGTINTISIAPIKETFLERNFVNVRPSRQLEELINIRPQVKDIFNKNETLPLKEIEKIVPEEFGVLGHIDPSRHMLVDALAGIASLRDAVRGPDAIVAKIKVLVDEIKVRSDVEALGINTSFWDIFDKKIPDLATISYPDGANLAVINLLKVSDIAEKLDKDTKVMPSSLYSAGLFSAGNSVRNDIREVEGLHAMLMRLHAVLSRALATKKNTLDKLDREIPERQRELANLDQARLKALGESKIVAALVEENWRKVDLIPCGYRDRFF